MALFQPAIIIIMVIYGVVSGQEMCRPNSPRSDCGYEGIDEYECEGKGCCWTPTEGEAWCYHKSTAPPSYRVGTVSVTAFGMRMTVVAEPSASSEFGELLSPLSVDFTMETSSRLHVKISPRNDKTRWQIPDNVSSAGTLPSQHPTELLYKHIVAKVGEYFYFAVQRVSDGEVIFNSSFVGQPLEFSDQFVAIATTLPGTESLYGLGEHKGRLVLERGKTYTLWNMDTSPEAGLNSYGSHPFYMDLRQSGKTHGVYMRNSNGMDVIYGDDFLTYRMIGGVVDMYFFLGPTPEGVVQQYQEVIGRPQLPPYWALGFHQCRYGYVDVQSLRDVVGNYSSNKIPLDGIWSDIDYMDEYKVFTLDSSNYPSDEIKQFVSDLHKNKQQYVVVLNPGIKVDGNYKPYSDGMENKVFIMNKNGKEFTGKQWPGIVVYPDFFKENVTSQYWTNQITEFYKTLVEVDGLWLNMNEISNFCNGECSNQSMSYDKQLRSVKELGFDPVDPPYKINNQGTNAPLNTKTLDMDAVHNGQHVEYNVHNLYGLMKSKPTASVLQTLRGKRSLVMSRSTFPGSGSYSGHTTGNNHASYDDMHYSISEMLNFQMFSIPLVGSDICGYLGDTTEELCSRWMELGAFYPFSRNHNSKESKPQEPYQWPSVANISHKVLTLRYQLLPYYYTLFYKASRPVTSTPSATVTRPLFFEFPHDLMTHYIDSQFMVGSALLISPVIEEGATSRDAYFPQGKWYCIYDGMMVVSSDNGATVTLNAPIDHIPVHVRGGSIIPGHHAGMTTAESRQNNSRLLVALDDDGIASGDLYIDDGESVMPTQYLFITFNATSQCSSGQLTSTINEQGSHTMTIPPMDTVKVLGVGGTPSKAFHNGEAIAGFEFNSSSNVMSLTKLNINLNNNFKITWQ